ncbi:hypothetical protein Cgig2_019090 [Carnegiea gigantea]|uniref:Uncharacterized protein n=1 Tax=Carnegiea gigantea TaxID=171969 RepID=A0A9Q1QGK9_9CARY|nr:hypothetical protein Cgig2_019090 [Carnegiea gigantea]
MIAIILIFSRYVSVGNSVEQIVYEDLIKYLSECTQKVVCCLRDRRYRSPSETEGFVHKSFTLHIRNCGQIIAEAVLLPWSGVLLSVQDFAGDREKLIRKQAQSDQKYKCQKARSCVLYQGLSAINIEELVFLAKHSYKNDMSLVIVLLQMSHTTYAVQEYWLKII